MHRQNKGDVTSLNQRRRSSTPPFIHIRSYFRKAVAEGQGKTKKESEQKAAERAYKTNEE